MTMPQTKQKKTLDLSQCVGGDDYYKHFTGLLYTDGVKTMAEQAGAYWLIDAVASYQRDKRVRNNKDLQEFQLWELHLTDTGGAILTCKRDSGLSNPDVIRQVIEFTDFPEDIKLYVENGVLLLPQEH